MRTTLILDDRLLRNAKREAAQRGVTLSELVGQALRAELDRRMRVAPHFEMVTFGSKRSRTHHEPGDFAQVAEEEDVESYGRR